MSIRNQNWYNLQATRRYPLDENSTGLDDANNFIHDDILVDCHIRFPNTYGKHVYVQGLTVSAGLVTVVFGVSTQDGATAGTPLAAVTVVKPVTPNLNYAITPLQPGVSGWVVFGHGTDENFAGRYTTVQQTLVSPRCARSYKSLPVPTIGKLGLAASLQGVVKILGELPVKVRYDAAAGRAVRMLDGEKVVQHGDVKALVVELDTNEITDKYNPLQLFLGPCGQRPESGTCPRPPIESINGVAPDCDGNIEIVFDNFFGDRPFADCGGVDIISSNDLPVLCDAADEPQKKRPKKYDDECCVAGFEVATETDLVTFPVDQRTARMLVRTRDTGENWRLGEDLVTWTISVDEEYCSWPDPTQVIPDIIIDEVIPDPAYQIVSLPACVDFANCAGDTKFTARSGTFSVLPVAAPPACPSCIADELDPDEINATTNTLSNKNVYVAESTVEINLATFNNSATDWAINKTISTELRIATSGTERNGGLVLNYLRSLNEAQQIQTTFIAVVLDASRGQLRVLRYTNNFVTLEGVAAMTVRTGAWYRISATPVLDGSNVALNVYAEEMTTTNKTTASMSVQIEAGSYGPAIGAAGVVAARSYTYFNKFTIVEQS